MEGWRILWKSEVEAIAIRANASDNEHLDIVELMENLGVKLKKVGKEHVGLCPFHDDHSPSLSVNHEKGVWKCHSTRCGKGGNAEQFLKELQAAKEL
jgi:DNA primase